MKTADFQRLDAAHYLHPFTDSGALGDTARIIVRADGVYLWDSDGNKILDGMSGLWCVNIGYGRHELANAAARQMRELPYYNSFFHCTTPASIQLAEKLAEVSPAGFNRVFYAGSGSEANDTVIRLLRYYWQLRDEPQRRVIIARDNAYHGSTVGAASLGGMAFMHAQGGLPIPDIAHIRQPYWYGESEGMTPEAFAQATANALREKIEEIGADNVAGFIGEPVQGAGGVIVPPDGYWQTVQRICDDYRVPLVSDEVICGFGRTGHWFGCEYFATTPKIIVIAKGMTSGYLPMGAVLVHDDIASVLVEKGGEFAHGYTYSGHPTCAAVGLENINIMQQENIIDRVREDVAPYLQQRWRELANHPMVGECRGVGMMAAMELKTDEATGAVGARCRDLSIKNGLVMRAVRDAMIIAPPLVIRREEIDELIDKAKKTLDELC